VTSLSEEALQQYRDADKLKYWRSACVAGNANQCPAELIAFLDTRMPGE
jgi:hypothetical protein